LFKKWEKTGRGTAQGALEAELAEDDRGNMTGTGTFRGFWLWDWSLVEMF
jgi:hypothetical protein